MTLPTIAWKAVLRTALDWLPYALIAAATVALYVANNKIDSLNATVAAKDALIETRTVQRDFFKSALDSRDELIRRQNSSIQALADAAAADRKVYLNGLEAARAVSADHLKASRELLALTAPEGELAQCRAARDLLEAELVQ